MKRNPKLKGSNLFDCRPQTGRCPLNCNQCYYNRPNAFYCDINKPNIPSPRTVDNGIVRMNTGHDSNIKRDMVIGVAKWYKHVFFNTSILSFDFPGPVVFTANPKEEELAISPHSMDWNRRQDEYLNRIMFVRLRTSASNLSLICSAVRNWTKLNIPVVLTFMAYYERAYFDEHPEAEAIYEWKRRHINSYYCMKSIHKKQILHQMKKIGGRLVTMCGTLESNYCKDCRNCESYYYITKKHMEESPNGTTKSN